MTFGERPIPPSTRIHADGRKDRAPVPKWAKVEGLREPPMRPVKQDAREMREGYEGGEG